MRTALAALLLFAAPATAQDELTSGLSQDVVEITSTYTGTDLVIFGAISRPPAGEISDVVVVVRGPDARMTVRRKERVAGLWINRASAKFGGMASYYFLAATRPLARIAPAEVLNRYGLGFASLNPGRVQSDGPPTPYRAALMRAMERHRLYTDKPDGVEMLSPTLFRVHVPLPAATPRGLYTVQVFLIRGGMVTGAQSTPLFVDQIGFERKLYGFAHQMPLLYGLSTVLMAVMLGWLSSLAFGRKN